MSQAHGVCPNNSLLVPSVRSNTQLYHMLFSKLSYRARTGYWQHSMVYSITPLLHTAGTPHARSVSQGSIQV